ncbi:unnamed protein product [Coffea canephora]|uniref:Uncharacterized protein n=1 Tax=Coffea canephora TaxID=49390 RepID=A0A068U3H8_COFCA|nr:unnamed protein product [Coffea canephora]
MLLLLHFIITLVIILVTIGFRWWWQVTSSHRINLLGKEASGSRASSPQFAALAKQSRASRI